MRIKKTGSGLGNDENMTRNTEGKSYHDPTTSASNKVMEIRSKQPFKFSKILLPNQTQNSQLRNTQDSIGSHSVFISDFVDFHVDSIALCDSYTYNVSQNFILFVASVPFASQVKPVFGDFRVDEVIECLL